MAQMAPFSFINVRPAVEPLDIARFQAGDYFDRVGYQDNHILSWPRKSAQDAKWSFCLTAGTLCPANQERP